jgi:hypothetical protein
MKTGKKVKNFSEKFPNLSWKSFQLVSCSYMCTDREEWKEEERDFNRPSTGASIRLKTLEMRIRITSINSTAIFVYHFYSLGAAALLWVNELRMEGISQYIWVISVGPREKIRNIGSLNETVVCML